MQRKLPRVCVIGAGASGLACSKVLAQAGIPFDCFEMGSGLGGLWRFDNDNGVSSCYRSLHINTSKRMMVWSDFPFKEPVAEYPSHEEILQYFEAYADHFDIRRRITFRTKVSHAERLDDGTWQIDLEQRDGARSVEHYDFLVVANGHHWDPRSPEFPGSFDGVAFHAHHYVDVQHPHDLRDKRVVVVGSGNSAMDVACELARIGQGAKKVYLSQRSGVWILPKVIGNVAQDKHVRHPMVKPSTWEHVRRAIIPRSLRLRALDAVTKIAANVTVGRPSRVGLKDPTGEPHERHPTVSQEIHHRLVHGDITPKGNIKQLMGDKVMFEDDSVVDVDAIIYCTGYNITFPFFDRDFISAPSNSLPLWQRMLHPGYPELAFIGLIQPLCSLMPIAELQSNLLASLLTGEFHAPPADLMTREMHQYDQMMKRLYTDSPSHTIQADCPEYSYGLRKAWKAGKRRAQRAGNTLPVPRQTAARAPERAIGA